MHSKDGISVFLSGMCYCSFFFRSTCWQRSGAFKWLGQYHWNKFQCCFCLSGPDRTMEGVSNRQLKGSGWVSKIYSHLGLPDSYAGSRVPCGEFCEAGNYWIPKGQGEGYCLWQETSEGQEWIKGKRGAFVAYLSLNHVNGWKVSSTERSGI